MAASPTVLHVLCSCSWSIITYLLKCILLLYTEVGNLDTSRKSICRIFGIFPNNPFITKIRIAIAVCQEGIIWGIWLKEKAHIQDSLWLTGGSFQSINWSSLFFHSTLFIDSSHCTDRGAKMMKTTGEGGLHMGTGKRQSELSAWGLGFCSHIQEWFLKACFHWRASSPQCKACRSPGLDIHTSHKWVSQGCRRAPSICLFLALQPLLFPAQVLLYWLQSIPNLKL